MLAFPAAVVGACEDHMVYMILKENQGGIIVLNDPRILRARNESSLKKNQGAGSVYISCRMHRLLQGSLFLMILKENPRRDRNTIHETQGGIIVFNDP